MVDNASFHATFEKLQNADLSEFAAGGLELKDWTVQPTLPVVTRKDGRTKITNSGAQTIVVAQRVAAEAGAELVLRWEGQVENRIETAEQASVEVHWDSLAEPVRVALPPRSVGPAVAHVTAPAGVSEAEIRLLAPAGVSIEVEQVSLRETESTFVTVTPVAEAPGELTLLNPRIALKEAPPRPTPTEGSPTCPPTPPELEPGELPEDCGFCPVCQKNVRLKDARSTVSPAGRQAVVAICSICNSRLVRAGAIAARTPASRATMIQRLPLSRRTSLRVPAETNLRALVTLVTASIRPLSRVHGIAEARAEKLYAVGIRDLRALADADPETVLEATRGVGVDREVVADWISQAKRLVIENS